MDFLISDKPRIERFEYKNKIYEIEVSDLGWAQKNKIIGKATKLDRTGNASFDIDIFNRECILQIIKKCKVIESDGKEKEFVLDAGILLGIEASFGSILEKFIPSPAIKIEKEEEKN